MKLKQSPDDFQVEELTNVVPDAQGPFALYRLEKRNLTTPDALALARERWRIEPRRLSFGGLKDRHAATIQYFSIFHGPRRNLNQQGLAINYLGQTLAPYLSENIRANRFAIVLRQLTAEQSSRALLAVEEVRHEGVPNYFDDQRFGSVSEAGEFIGRLLVQGRFEDALRMALTEPYEFDTLSQKREKETLRTHWGDWLECQRKLKPGQARRLIEYLVHRSTDFRGALERLRPEMRALYLSAYQSELWNRILALFLHRLAPTSLLSIEQRRGSLPFPRGLDETQQATLAALDLPLPSARLKLAPDGPHGELIRAVLAEEGFTLEQMKVRGSRDLFFSRGERLALCRPGELSSSVEEDERHPGRRKLRLNFEMPRGSYATLVVKRVTAS